MDDILQKLAQHRNFLAAVFLIALGAFLAALIVSGDIGVIAQALGNVIGAAIGAVGAAGAIVWQMGKHERARAAELRTVRIALYRHVDRTAEDFSQCLECLALISATGADRQVVYPLLYQSTLFARKRVLDPNVQSRIASEFAPAIHWLEYLKVTIDTFADAVAAVGSEVEGAGRTVVPSKTDLDYRLANFFRNIERIEAQIDRFDLALDGLNSDLGVDDTDHAVQVIRRVLRRARGRFEESKSATKLIPQEIRIAGTATHR